jgi:hypothetical protein
MMARTTARLIHVRLRMIRDEPHAAEAIPMDRSGAGTETSANWVCHVVIRV